MNKIPGNESWIAYDPLYTPGASVISSYLKMMLFKLARVAS
jgi:hypothetical protein